MSQNGTYSGTTYAVPETDEVDWGETVTALLIQHLLGGNTTECVLTAANQGAHRASSTSTTLAAGATLTQTYALHKVAGSGAAVTLSATNSIADGTFDDQVLIVQGSSATNTVTILDGSNTRMNGNITLAQGDTIAFRWDLADSNWWEMYRST
jgi:hypothetical protein